MTKLTINKLNIAQIFFSLFLVSLFFPIRYVFPTKEAFQTGAYSDFTSISLYLSDIFLFTTILFLIPPRGELKKLIVNCPAVAKAMAGKQLSIVVFITWLILDLIWHYSSISSLNWWFFAKYLELVVSYGTACYLFIKTDIKVLFIRTFLIFSSLESILALWQFKIQKSIGHGLGKLGEQIIGPKIQGIAKIVSGGTTYIRGYGTFPHPNLLSAFLVVGVLLSIYLLLQATSSKLKALYGFVILLNTLGLTVTFSRAGFLALAVGLVIFFGYLSHIAKPQTKKQIYSSCLIVLLGLLISFVIFKPYLSTRATITDDASLERIFYAKIGLKMVEQNPIFGLGIGDSVLHMQQYLPTLNFSDKMEIIKSQSGGDLEKFDENKQKFMAGEPIKLWPWQIQPIHNYFLLAAAEIGIPGALILIWIFLSHLWSVIKKVRSEKNFALATYYLLLTTILVSFLLAMQFDHYFYTLQQTQMLLWVILGIISAEIKKHEKNI